MLPYEKEQIMERLIRAGYFRHRVERMKPWTLLHCMRTVKTRQKGGHLTEYLPYVEPSYMNSSMLTNMWKETVVKNNFSTRGYK